MTPHPAIPLPVSVPVENRKEHFHRLHYRVLAGVALGVLTGLAFGTETILFGVGTAELGQAGMLVIRALKTLAIPLVLFAILNALCRAVVSRRQGLKLVSICALNVSVAAAIALAVLNLFHPGLAWTEKIKEADQMAAHALGGPAKDATLNPLRNLSAFVPTSIFQPFLENNLITVVLMALFLGAAIRGARRNPDPAVQNGMRLIESGIAAAHQLLLQMLQWVIAAVPIAVFLVVAQAVGRSGLAVFASSAVFLGVIAGGLLVHALIYYPIAAWFFGGRSPKEFFSASAPAILTGLSTNSSLATIPVTLHCLKAKLGVSDSSATLSACIGTNLNNDGVTLYEAMAALFLAQACGMQLALPDQMLIIAASIMAAIGCAGIPEAGLIILPLVLGAAGLPENVVAAAIPLLLPTDWLIARVRSAVNVMSDILVALMLDGRAPAKGGLRAEA